MSHPPSAAAERVGEKNVRGVQILTLLVAPLNALDLVSQSHNNIHGRLSSINVSGSVELSVVLGTGAPGLNQGTVEVLIAPPLKSTARFSL